jgi:flagellar hook-associated protein 3 FlgL
MTYRISEFQLSRSIVASIHANKQAVGKAGEEVSSGVKVELPGETTSPGVLADLREQLRRAKGFESRISNGRGYLDFQENVLNTVSNVMLRARELASQGANETFSSEERLKIAEEVFAIRDNIVELANSQYHGRYIYGNADDDDPPFDPTTYTQPTSGAASVRYAFDAEAGTTIARQINITDTLDITLTTSGDTIFSTIIGSLESLGRALSGYTTTLSAGVPTGAGTALTLPDQYTVQTTEIANALNLISTAITTRLEPERANLAARQTKLDAATSIIENIADSTEAAIRDIQGADSVQAATELSQAQSALEASYTVSSRILNLTILDYL